MITSMYEDFFEALLRGMPLQVSALAINERSMLTQWSRFKNRQFGAGWLKQKTLAFSTTDSITTITLVDSTRKRTPITFTSLDSLDSPHAKENLPTPVGTNQTG